MYLYPSLVTALTLIVYQVLTVNVGRARMKYKIMPPAMSGDENFERVVRVQQ
ncbi:MAG: MAPEG family protein, partial [Snowella sp.]